MSKKVLAKKKKPTKANSNAKKTKPKRKASGKKKTVSKVAKKRPISIRKQSKRIKSAPIRKRKSKLRKRIESEESRDKEVGISNSRRTELFTLDSLTPTKNGFRRIKTLAGEIARVGDFSLFSADFSFSFTGKDGRKIEKEFHGVGIPQFNAIDLENYNRKNKYRNGGEIGKKECFERKVEGIIRRTIFKAVMDEYGFISPAKHKALKMDKGRAKNILDNVKQKRDVRFSMKLYREKI